MRSSRAVACKQAMRTKRKPKILLLFLVSLGLKYQNRIESLKTRVSDGGGKMAHWLDKTKPLLREGQAVPTNVSLLTGKTSAKVRAQ